MDGQQVRTLLQHFAAREGTGTGQRVLDFLLEADLERLERGVHRARAVEHALGILRTGRSRCEDKDEGNGGGGESTHHWFYPTVTAAVPGEGATLRPIASAMVRSSFINRVNWSG